MIAMLMIFNFVVASADIAQFPRMKSPRPSRDKKPSYPSEIKLDINENGDLLIHFAFAYGCDFKYTHYDSESGKELMSGDDSFKMRNAVIKTFNCKNLTKDSNLHYALKVTNFNRYYYTDYGKKLIRNSEEEISIINYIHIYYEKGAYHASMSKEMSAPYSSDLTVSLLSRPLEDKKSISFIFSIPGPCNYEYKIYDSDTNELVKTDKGSSAIYSFNKYVNNGIKLNFLHKDLQNGEAAHYDIKAVFNIFNYKKTDLGYKLISKHGESQKIERHISIENIDGKYKYLIDQ